MDAGMISVDKWSSGSQAYFLTHLHSDHTAGLSSTWRRGPLFCSRVTAKLLPCKFPGFDLSLIRIVEIGSWHSLSLISPSSGTPTTVRVKTIDAHHCPGSVMYLFRGDFGCMLFTGDFRWETSCDVAKNGKAMLLDALKDDKLDVLHIDNTYCNPRYQFPSRDVAARQVVDLITSHPDHDIIIGIDSLGKEDLLLYVSNTLKIKIWVWPERLQIMHLLGFHHNFTTQTSLTRVRAVPRYSFSIETLEGLNAHRPTIGIMPSGLPWATTAMIQNGHLFDSSSSTTTKKASSNKDEPDSDSGGHPTCARRHHQHIYVVPYSNHSCFSEIKDLIQLLSPIKMKGIVSASSCYIDPNYYFDHLLVLTGNGTEERRNTNDAATETKPVARNEAAGSKKRRLMDYVNFSGVRVSRVRLLRSLSRGVKIADNEHVLE